MSAPPDLGKKATSSMRAVLIAAAMLPALAVVAVISIYAVNVPFYDEWNMAVMFRNFADHTLSLHDFIGPHSEHRPVVIRIIYFTTGYLAHGDVRAHMFFNVVSACVLSFGIFSLSRSSGRSVDSALLMLIPTNLLIFGTIQSENWLWGQEGHLPAAVVVGCLAVAASGLKDNIKFPLCIVLAITASFTLAYGLSAWVVALPVLLVRSEVGWRGRKLWFVAWAVFMVLSILPYAMAAPKPGGNSPLMILATYPLAGINYFCVLLGAPLASGLLSFGLWPAFLVGACLAGLSLFCLLYVLRFWGDEEFRREAIIWVALLAFPLATDVMITLGRVSAGVTQATSSRYTTVTAILIVALMYLTGAILRHVRRRNPTAISDIAEARAVTAVLTLMLCLHAVTTMSSFRDIEGRRRFMLGVKTLVTWCQVAYDEHDLGTNVSGPPTPLRELADSLDRQGMLSPKLMRSDIISGLADETPSAGGKVEVIATRDDNLVFEGWAILPNRREVADGVLLCWNRPGEPRHVFAVTMEKTNRPEIAKSLGDSRYVWCGWTASVPRSRVPADVTQFSAFAYDSLTARMYQLSR